MNLSLEVIACVFLYQQPINKVKDERSDRMQFLFKPRGYRTKGKDVVKPIAVVEAIERVLKAHVFDGL